MNPVDPSAPLRRLNELIDGLTKDSCENWKHLVINETIDIFGENSYEHKSIMNFRFYSQKYEQHIHDISTDNYTSKIVRGLVVKHDYTNIEQAKGNAKNLLNTFIKSAQDKHDKEINDLFE